MRFHRLKSLRRRDTSTSHNTNACKAFRQHIQRAIEQGRIKFESARRPMKIDGHPFPASTNMVDVTLIKGKAKVLTSAKAKEARTVDPRMQITADEYKEARKQRDV